MADTLKQFKARALARPEIKQAYDELDEEFAFLEEVLKARVAAGLTQAQVAERIGTTQSAIARLESPTSRRFPSVATLQKYARALGCRVEIRLVPDQRAAKPAARRAKRTARGAE
jgi:transcriptional regulator with XRE-family HTH domain